MRSQRTTTTFAQVALALIMAGHQTAETARDALFLSKLGPTELPTVYLILAAVGVPVALLPSSRRRPLTAGLLWLFAPVTASFAWTIDWTPQASRALYVWIGLSTTIVVTFFWRFLADRYDVHDAKSTFPRIALGGIVGAALGALGARALVEYFDTRWLLVLAGALTAIGGVVTTLLQRRVNADDDQANARKRHASTPREPSTRPEGFLEAFRSPYVRSVGLLLVAASVTFTSLDYTFKAVIANQVHASDLASSFATFYLVLNVAALVTQLVLARRVLHWVGLGTLVLFLPGLIVLGSAAIAIGGGIVAALALKGIDGSLRHSLHRTSTELLYVPMSAGARSVTKPIYDIVGKRGGQALASVLILVLLQFSTTTQVYAIVTAALALAWFVGGIVVRRRYLGMFRSALRDRAAFSAQLPELGMGELSTMLEALNSESDGEVIGAIDVLEAHGQASTIPDLILYHPSPAVVVRSLASFQAEGRARITSVVARLLDHASPEVRTEALLALAAFSDATDHIGGRRDDPDPVVRGVAAALAWNESERVDWASVFSGEHDAEALAYQLGVARAYPYLADRTRDALRPEHVANASTAAMTELARGMAARPRRRDLPHYIAFLAFRGPREHARAALVALDEPALEACQEAFRAPDTPLAVRVHLPRTLSLFDPEQVAPILAECIVDEIDELVRHKALRGLGRIVATHPDLPLNQERLASAVEHELSRTFRMIAVRCVLERVDLDEEPKPVAPIHRTVLALLAESERRGIEHIFRLLHLMNPQLDLETVYKSVISGERRHRIGARELLTDLVEIRFRAGVLALVSDDDDSHRLEIGEAWLERPVEDVGTALDELLRGRGPLEQAAQRYVEVRAAWTRQSEVA